MDKGSLHARRSSDTGHFTIDRQSYKYIAARDGRSYDIPTESVDQGHGQRRYRRTKTAAEDDAHYDAGNVWVHILQYAVRHGLVLGGEYALDHSRTVSDTEKDVNCLDFKQDIV